MIHDILVRDKVVPNSTILPVSAQILTQMEEYDATLEVLSRLIGRKAKYRINDVGEMTVLNPQEIEVLYRFPDLSKHTVFLAKALQATVQVLLLEELRFLQRYDELKSEIQRIVDMPDHKVDRMILFLHQNKGKLAKRKRKFFMELSDGEIEGMEGAYLEVFGGG